MEKEKNISLAERIINYRIAEELSQAGLALKVGVDRATINKAEMGRRVSKAISDKIERFIGGDLYEEEK